jgi:hypothetical protein
MNIKLALLQSLLSYEVHFTILGAYSPKMVGLSGSSTMQPNHSVQVTYLCMARLNTAWKLSSARAISTLAASFSSLSDLACTYSRKEGQST